MTFVPSFRTRNKETRRLFIQTKDTHKAPQRRKSETPPARATTANNNEREKESAFGGEEEGI